MTMSTQRVVPAPVGTTVISNGRNLLNSVTVVTDAALTASVVIYDNTAASGKILLQVVVPAAELSRTVTLDRAIVAEIGLTASVVNAQNCFVGFGAS